MVQIIPFFFAKSVKLHRCFISHMVQIIPNSFANLSAHFPGLYIPHGSDNTLTGPLSVLFPHFFISHMVQIIQFSSRYSEIQMRSFISHMVQIIRAKQKTGGLKQLPLFISHMVQIIRSLNVLAIINIMTLYPTWFR